MDKLDVLVIDEMGKNISGVGMDTNIIGRMYQFGTPEPVSAASGLCYGFLADMAIEDHAKDWLNLRTFYNRKIPRKCNWNGSR